MLKYQTYINPVRYELINKNTHKKEKSKALKINDEKNRQRKRKSEKERNCKKQQKPKLSIDRNGRPESERRETEQKLRCD